MCDLCCLLAACRALCFDGRPELCCDGQRKSRILETLAAESRQGETMSLYTSSLGPVFEATVQYEALLRGISSTYVGDYVNPDWLSVLAKAQNSDIVIASEAGALGQGGCCAYPGIQYQNRLIAALTADTSWWKLTTYVDQAGFKTIVFTRFRPTSNQSWSVGNLSGQ